MGEKLQLLIAMAGYMLIVILIGILFAKKSQANSENYFLGGRSLGPWVAAMSAEASDMSGWLLMVCPALPIGAALPTPPGRLSASQSAHISTGCSSQRDSAPTR